MRTFRLLGPTALLLVGFGLLGRASAQDLYDDTVLRTLHLTFHQDDWWNQLTNNKNKENGKYIRADLVVDGVLYVDVGVRFKGYSSYYFSSGLKKPFKIDLDAFVAGQELMGYDAVRLNNCWTDPTFVREPVMYKLLRDYCPGTKCNFVILTINGENWGVYVNDQQKDGHYMSEWYRENTGNRYKLTEFGGNLKYWGTDPANYDHYYDSQSDSNPDPWTDLIHLCDVLNNTSMGRGLEDALRPILDIDGSMWMIAINNVFSNMDSYQDWGNNFYVFHDDYHDRMEVLLHDLNMSFGTFGGSTNLEPTYHFFDTNLPLVGRMFQNNQRLRNEYFHHCRVINERIFDWSVIEPLVLQYQALIDAAVQADDKKLYSYTKFKDNVYQQVTADGYRVPGLAPFVMDRHRFLANHADVMPADLVELDDLLHTPEEPTDGDPVTVTVRVSGANPANTVRLRWRVQGAFQQIGMKDDGASGDGAAGDGVYGAQIPAQSVDSRVDYFALATAVTSVAKTFLPEAGERGASSYLVRAGAVLVNEFVASNDSGPVDENGEFEDWIELYNASATTVDLGGYFLTDDPGDLSKWEIPSGTSIDPGTTLMIWADDEPGDGPYHATFKLSSDGEDILLVEADKLTVRDHISFGAQQADVATGRLLDGGPFWVTLPEPTPDLPNKPSCGTRQYDALDPSANPVEMVLNGSPQLGQSVSLDITGGPPSGYALLFLGASPDYYSMPNIGIQLVGLNPSARFLLPLDGTGSTALPATIPNDPSLLNYDLYLQAWCIDTAGAFSATNAVELRICP